MNNEEKIYQFNDYILSYDKNINDRSSLTISKIQSGNMYLMGELCDGSADVVSMILDSLQTTVNYCKQENARLKEEKNKQRRYYQNRLMKYQEKINDLQSVVDKAIEYIEKDYKFANYDIPLLTKDEQLAGKLLDILKGVKDETN